MTESVPPKVLVVMKTNVKQDHVYLDTLLCIEGIILVQTPLCV
jgi:hypothetical protein